MQGKEIKSDMMDEAGVEDKKQAAVFRNRRFWHVLILCSMQSK